MPTYKNSFNYAVSVIDDIGNTVVFNANETKEYYTIISDLRILKISDMPFYNPMVTEEFISLAPSASIEYTCDLSSKSIKCIPLSGQVTIFINSLDNLPGIILVDEIILLNNSKIQTLYLINGPESSITDIKEMWI